MRKITDRYPGHQKIRLGIGEGGIYNKPTIITTVLGSCVSVTFFNSTKQIGAIFHALLPTIPKKEMKRDVIEHYKFVDAAINHILHSFYRRGIKKKQIEAKVFGGAEGAFKGIIQPGKNNIVTAFKALGDHNVKIVASDIGGELGRNLIFVSDTGEVFVKSHSNFPGQSLQKAKEINSSISLKVPNIRLP